MLLVDHAAFDIAVLAALRTDFEFLASFWGGSPHVQDERDDEDDNKSDDDGNRENEITCCIHALAHHSLESHEGKSHESRGDKSDRHSFHGLRDIVSVHPLSHAGEEDDDDEEAD